MRTGPKVDSGKRAMLPLASSSSTVRSGATVSLAGRFGFGADGCFAAFLVVSRALPSRSLRSRGTLRAPGFWSVLPMVRSNVDSSETDQARRSESGSVTVSRAGQRAAVLSRPTGVLFQPSVAMLLRNVDDRDRAGASLSFHVLSESPSRRTPGAVPVVTSTSSSKVASQRVRASA
ncbi:MAG: hypothetical protein EBV77_05605 [Gemmatimonadaceae bacterium]|nr:hypothetical protein [Gemmatimonadaceae bacterium]